MEITPLIVNRLREQVDCLVNLLDKLEEGTQVNRPCDADYRVIHYKNNPMKTEIKAQQMEMNMLEMENKRLRAKCEMLESGNGADVTRRIDDAVNTTIQVKLLKRKISEYKQREEKILDSFRRTSRDYRKAIYLLTGYRIEALKGNIYRLTSVFAEGNEDKLLFEISPFGALKLLKNEFSRQFSEFVVTYLENADSVPAFLAAINLDLFKSTTQLSPMSMCISTTMRPSDN